MRKRSIVALVAAVLAVVVPGLLLAGGPGSPGREGAGPGVADQFWFLHRDLGTEGSLTVRLTAMTGTITYPPPDHDEIVSGLVPWAKVGLILKDGLRQGSPYAAVMMTGDHGVRFQHNYRHDVAGRPGGVSEQAPRWLRLTRSGATVTGSESVDGKIWETVGTARLDGLPDTVQIGLFATSPGDLTLRRVALGGSVEEVRFTQAVGVFDNVSPGGAWASDPVGEMNRTDWERLRHASGAVEQAGVVTVSGAGDIGPFGDEPLITARLALMGLPIALIIVLVVGTSVVSSSATGAVGRRPLLAMAAASFLTGLIAVGVVVPVPRVAIGLGVAFALCAILAGQLRELFGRRWAAVVVSTLLVFVPYVVTTVALLPDPVAQWLLRVTPAAGFAAGQTLVEYPQVTAHYAPSAGYFPLSWWAGLLVLGAYPAVLALIVRRRRAGRWEQPRMPRSDRSPRRHAGV
ncbi:hypothetical protein FB565_003491 [Actinoplanes lutulentus]|uniref:Uncharacterized protein n=1 Tax=Actinoplanes lutulentus TaxID=1287878 RepID=A0A327Z7K0_9ACTN|nr:hypothetical protein [Actinoplanes lutulentus]MBB2943762.1 hypothetical protein [Actinoplanes lutulentus]RAK29304.1 hypothetical protein B0I29_11896 [Actinoplanes lutulentus]